MRRTLIAFALTSAFAAAQTAPPVAETPVASLPRGPLVTTDPGIVIPGLSDHDARVLEVPMNDSRILRVPTHPSVNTTCIFPEPISGLDGAGFTMDPGNASGDFLISFTPGNSFFSITPLTGVSRRNINVVIGGHVYVIEPFPVPSYMLAAASVKFVRQSPNLYRTGDAAGAAINDLPAARRSAAPPSPQFASAGAGKLISLLDTLKLLSSLHSAELEAMLKAMPHIQFAIKGSEADVQDFGNFSVRLDRVVRNNKIDALAFEVTVRNKSKRTLTFDPESLAVRVGDELHPQVVTDFSPMLPPEREAKGYFAIITSPDGSPNYLAVTNDFRVSIAEGFKLERARGAVATVDASLFPRVQETTTTVDEKAVVKPVKVSQRQTERAKEKPRSTAAEPTPIPAKAVAAVPPSNTAGAKEPLLAARGEKQDAAGAAASEKAADTAQTTEKPASVKAEQATGGSGTDNAKQEQPKLDRPAWETRVVKAEKVDIPKLTAPAATPVPSTTVKSPVTPAGDRAASNEAKAAEKQLAQEQATTPSKSADRAAGAPARNQPANPTEKPAVSEKRAVVAAKAAAKPAADAAKPQPVEKAPAEGEDFAVITGPDGETRNVAVEAAAQPAGPRIAARKGGKK